MARRRSSSPQVLGCASAGHPGCLRESGLLVRGDGGGHAGGPEGVSRQRHEKPQAQQRTPSPYTAGVVPVLPAPSAHRAHRGAGSEYPAAHAAKAAVGPQPRSQPRGSSLREPDKPLKTCRGTFQYSEPGRREHTSPAPTGLSPSSARWRFTCRQLAGTTHRSKGRRHGTSRLKPQQVHGHGQRRTAVWAGRPPDPGQEIEPSNLFMSHRQQRHVTRVPNSRRRGKHQERTHTVAHVPGAATVTLKGDSGAALPAAWGRRDPEATRVLRGRPRVRARGVQGAGPTRGRRAQ